MNVTSATQRWGRVILATGHRRGGTTWLGRMLSLSQNSGYIFEPLTHTRHPQTAQVAALKHFNRTTQRWILSWPPACQNEAEYASVVARHIEELFDMYFAAPVGTLIIKQPGIEHLPFLHGVLQPEMSVYIKRHPVAILNSYHKSNLYDAWNTRQQFQWLRNDIARLRPDLSYILSDVGADHETQVLSMCCIAHRLAQDWAREGKLTVINYEDLAKGGPAGAEQLFSKLDLELSKEKVDQLNSLFSPRRPLAGFLDTEKDSKRRVTAYTSELAPWQISKAARYLEGIGYDAIVPSQSTSARISGTLEYCRREGRTLHNSAHTALSQMTKRHGYLNWLEANISVGRWREWQGSRGDRRMVGWAHVRRSLTKIIRFVMQAGLKQMPLVLGWAISNQDSLYCITKDVLASCSELN